VTDAALSTFDRHPSTRILVLDDDKTVARAVGRMLAHHEVIQETNPEAALARIRAGERLDLVLCDMTMPGMSGADVLDWMRARCGTDCPMLVLMSGAKDVTAASADAFLKKPFRAAELHRLVAVSRELRRQRTPVPHVTTNFTPDGRR
jgi:CheY-like chemotaxis protein